MVDDHAAALAHHVSLGPSFAMLRVDLAPGQGVTAEAGAMVAHTPDIAMETTVNADRSAGVLASIWAMFIAFLRKVIGGETFFVNHFTTRRGGSLWLAPTMAGQIEYRRMRGDALMLSAGAYVAHSGNLRTRLKFGGLRSILAKEGAFFLEVSGEGDLWFTSYGGIHAVDVRGTYLVDNGHLVGFEGALHFSLSSGGGGLLGLVASGEGMVCAFHGEGRVYLQSRNPHALVGWLEPLLPR
ncbi:MAG: TIGR00266 family protein [Polyangiales bacterium]|nr:TIGR00266 family protein [Myxococcales bacterium]